MPFVTTCGHLPVKATKGQRLVLHKYLTDNQRVGMTFNIEGYTDEQLQAALDFANIDNAIELWHRKDWATYQETRKTLWARFPRGLTEWRMFTSDLPPGRSTDEPSWAVATAGEFWNVIL
jgi:hypothetical protein